MTVSTWRHVPWLYALVLVGCTTDVTVAEGTGDGARIDGGTSHSDAAVPHDVDGAVAVDLATGAVVTAKPAYYVDQGKLYDPCGVEVVLRGVNKMAVYADRPGNSFPEIAQAGANTVRFMWDSQVAAPEAVQTLQRAVDSQLIPIWQLADATGDFSKMSIIKSYWTAPGTIAVLKQFEAHVIVNIANEGGNTVPDATMISTYTDIVASLRTEGLRMPLMIDAAGWGRNVEQLLSIAPTLLANDPLHNILFSWHEYDSGAGENARIDSAIATAIAMKIPFLIGEFGVVTPGACGNNVPYKHLITEAHAKGIGYLPWSWDNFNSDCDPGSGSPFNLVSDGIHLSTLQAGWATEVVTSDAASIKNTAKRTAWQISPSTGSCTP